jgi:branched-chain amino acid transport system permease protein
MKGRLGMGLAVLVGFLIVLPAAVPTFYVQLTTEILVMAIFSVATNLLFGYSGMISFGQAAYYGIGAYTLALLVMKVGVPFGVGFVAAPLVAALFAAVVGFFCVRLTIIYFAMLTLGFAQLLYTIVFQWVSVTGGDDGLHGVPIPALFHQATAYYYFTLAMTLLALGVMWRVVQSPFGYALRAIRDNRERAEFNGINLRRYQLIAFTIAGCFSGLAGALFVPVNKAVFPNLLFWAKSAEPLFAILLGGIHTFLGPAVGAAIFILLEQFTSKFWHLLGLKSVYWPIVMGSVIVILIFTLPRGVAGSLIRLRPAR